MKMNKKAVAQIPVAVYWIVAIVVGLLLANEAGLFSTFLPHPSAEGKPAELVNLYYYDSAGTNPAVDNYQFNCALNSLVIRAKNTNWADTTNWLVLFRSGTYVGYPIITTNGGDGVGTVKNPSVTTSSPKVPYIPYTIYDYGDNLYIFKRDRNETITNCMVCQSSTNPILYKDLNPSGSCSGVSENFVKFRTTDTAYTSSTSIAIGEPYFSASSGQLTSYQGTNGACTDINCQSSTPLYSVPGAYYMGISGSDACICLALTNNLAKRFIPSLSAIVSTSVNPSGSGGTCNLNTEVCYSVTYPTCNIYDTVFNHYYYQYSNTATPAVPSQFLVAAPLGSPYYEFYNDGATGSNPYILTGQNYTHRDVTGDGVNDIVLQSCVQKSGGNDYNLLQTCEAGQAGRWFSATATSGLFGKPAVKCGSDVQWYTQNKQLCRYQPGNLNYATTNNNYFYQTNIDGTSISQPFCDTTYGGRCVQDTNTLTVKQAHCMLCSGGVSRCDPLNNKIIQTCSGDGTWTSAAPCSGDSECQLDSGSYICKSGYSAGTTACGGQGYLGLPSNTKQRYIRNAANDGWTTNGAECRTQCDTTNPVKCTNECNWIEWASCSNGLISYCDRNTDTGNVLSPTGYAPKTCAYPLFESPRCNSAGTGCEATYELDKTYCISGHLKIGATGGDLLTQVGIKLNEVYQCQIGCTESTPPGTASCIRPSVPPASKCLRAYQIVCNGLYNKVQCNFYKDYTTPLAVGGTAGPHQYCDDSNTNIDAQWMNYPTDCDGGMKCVDGTTIKSCDTSGYFDGRFTEECSGNGCTETILGQPQCNADPVCAGLSFSGDLFYGCEGTLISWPCNRVLANDYDGKKIIKGSPSLTCSTQCIPTASTNPADRCQAACTGSQTCEGDNVLECILGSKGGVKWSCNGRLCNTATSSCNSDCGGISNLNGIPDGYSCDTQTQEQRYCYAVYAPGSTTTITQRLLARTPCIFGCDSSTGKCNTQCTSSEIAAGQKCVGDDIYACAANGEQAANPSWSCNGKGCSTDGINCKNECGPGVIGEEATYHCEGTISKFCNTLYSDLLNPTIATQRIYVDTPCSFECDQTTGKCKSQCGTELSVCAADGNIHECVGGSQQDKILNYCMGKGCTTIAGKAVCVNDCSSADVDKGLKCVSSTGQLLTSCTGLGCKVIICKKNETTINSVTYTQFYNNTVSCGMSGCAYSGNQYKCTGDIAYANSFDCGKDPLTNLFNGQIWKTDANGVAYELYDTCTVPPKTVVNFLSPYCVRGSQFCHYCELTQLYCINSNTDNTGISFACANATTGAIAGQDTCNVGCRDGRCDKSFIILPDTTNFPLSPNSDTGNVYMQLTIKGATSEKPIVGATVTAVLTGTGIQTQTQTGLKTLADGTLANPIQFGSLVKGMYNITIIIQGYISNNVQVIPIVVTDSFIVKKYLIDILYLIPGVSPSIEIQVISPKGAVPDSLFVSSFGNMSSAPTVVRSQDHPDRWILTLPASVAAGDYLIGFKPSQAGVDQTDILEQKLKFTVSTPSLKADLNSPESATPGKHEYVLSITGPGYDGGLIKSIPLAPDIVPKATITYSSSTTDLTLLDQGGGRYLFSYDFKDSGTYTINIQATKAGYTGGTLSKPIQISGSGTEAPPKTDGSGTSTGGTVASPGGIIGAITGGGISTYFIIGIVLVVIYLILTGRKRR